MPARISRIGLTVLRTRGSRTPTGRSRWRSPIGAAMSIAMTVTIRVPTRSVAMSNMTARGNQPAANSWDSSICDRKLIASKTRDRTIPMLTRIERRRSQQDQADRAFIAATIAVPRRRPRGGGVLAAVIRSSPALSRSCDRGLSVRSGGRRNRPDHPSWPGRFEEEEATCWLPRPSAWRRARSPAGSRTEPSRGPSRSCRRRGRSRRSLRRPGWPRPWPC